MEPYPNWAQLFLLPAVFGTLESARKLLGAGYGLGYEFCAAFRAVHVRELFANYRRELDPPASSGAGIRA